MPRREAKSKYTADRNFPGAFEGETVTRRRLMTLTAHGAGALATAAFALPALGFAAGSAIFERPEVEYQAVGPPDEFPDDTYIPKVITTVAGIGEIGKTVVYMRAHNEEIDGPREEALGSGADFIALSNRCMHLGCPVRFVEASQRFICPCHGGVYDDQGKRTGGPPVRPLDRFETRVRAGRVEIGDRYSVNSKLEKKKPRDPSNHLDGLWQYLYPSRPTT